jgi:hypothetical protein
MCILRYRQNLNWKITLKQKPLRFILSSLLVMCSAFYGCTTLQMPDYPKTAANSLKNATTKNDLCIAVRAITDKNDLDQYFGADLIADNNVLPVYVVAENRNPSTSFLLFKDHIALQHKQTGEDGKRGYDPVTGRSIGGEITSLVGAGGLVLLFAGQKAQSNAAVIKQNIVSKELQTRTISPGKSVDGFVYFTLPDKKFSLADWSVSLDAKELGSNYVHQFLFTIE